MKNRIIDLIDFEKINNLLEGFNKTTGLATAILDLQGNILSKSEWRQICTEFHRINPETSKRCTISDTELAGKMAEGEKYHFYKCLNGLVDVAVPVIIDEEHIANLFSGQFFFEEPDRLFFKKQAEKFGFDEEKYLKALEKIPVVSKEKVQVALDFLLYMTQVISEMTSQKIEQIELTKALKQSEERWQFAIEGNGDGLWDWNVQTNEIFFSNQWKKMLGFHENEIENKFDEWDKRVHPDDKAKAYVDIQKHLDDKTDEYNSEYRMLCKDGTYKWILDRGKTVARTIDNKPLRFIGTHTDITERKKAEALTLENKNRLDYALNSIDTGVWELDLGNGSSWRSFKHDKIFGYKNPLEHWTYEMFLEHVIPEDRELVNEKFQKAISTKSDWDFECRINRKDGAVRWIHGKGNHGLDDKNEVTRMFGTVQDITDRKMAEIMLRDEKEQKRTILEFVGNPIFLKDDDHRIVFANRAFFDLFELDEESVIGKTLAENVPEKERKHFLKIDRNVLDTGIPDYREEELTVGGQTNTIITRKTRFIDASGNKFLVGSILNITDRKNAEEALKESEEKFRLAFHTSPDSININRLNDGMYVDINDSFTQMSGYTREETIGRTSVEINIWENNEDRNRLVAGLKENGKVENLEAKFRLKNGRVNDGLMSASVISIAGVPHILSITRDITKIKQTEEQIRNSEARERQILLDSEKRYRDLFENIAVGFVLFEVVQDEKGIPIDLIIIAANKFFEKTTGLLNKEVEGKLLSKVLPGIEKDTANWIGTYGKIAITGESKQFEQGSELLGNYFRVSAFRSEPKRCAVTFLDITEHKQAEAKIKKLNQDLENRVQERTLELSNSQAALLNIVEDLNEKTDLLEKSSKLLETKNKELETFTYSVSHDLKAPLRGIDGYSRLLEEMYSDKLQGEGLSFIKTIREGTKQMNQLIEDLLGYSRLERTVFRTSGFNVKKLIESNIKLVLNDISGTKATLTLNIEDCEVNTDYNGFSIVFRNLLENAIKFSSKVEAPQIFIILKENVNSWLLTVEDNGIGFDMKYHGRIFEIFQRLNLPEQYAGTGIGLAMVKKSVDRMHGKIWAESSPGKGAKFYLEIPKK